MMLHQLCCDSNRLPIPFNGHAKQLLLDHVTRDVLACYSPPSRRASTARIKNGTSLPTNWYITPPKGGPTETTHRDAIMY